MQRLNHRYRIITIGVACITLVIGFATQTYADSNTENAGHVLQVVLPALAFGMTFAYDDSPGRTQFYKSFLSTMGTTYALKYTVKRERPDGGDHSFPSGHTSAAFSGASFMQRRYGWKYGIPAYAAASFVGWSRYDADKHHTSDILASVAIAVTFTYIFTTPYDSDVQFIPYIDQDTYSVAVQFSF